MVVMNDTFGAPPRGEPSALSRQPRTRGTMLMADRCTESATLAAQISPHGGAIKDAQTNKGPLHIRERPFSFERVGRAS